MDVPRQESPEARALGSSFVGVKVTSLKRPGPNPATKRQRSSALFGHYSAFEVRPLDCLLNETILLIFLNELISIARTGHIFLIADREHRHHIASRHNTPPW